jgi:hypothetical protein
VRAQRAVRSGQAGPTHVRTLPGQLAPRLPFFFFLCLTRGAHKLHLPPANSSAAIRVRSCPQKSGFLVRFCSRFLAPHPRKISYKYPLILAVFTLKNLQETLTPEPGFRSRRRRHCWSFRALGRRQTGPPLLLIFVLSSSSCSTTAL